jgi:colanic acid biosynthesis glycosyl transferase WcaI
MDGSEDHRSDLPYRFEPEERLLNPDCSTPESRRVSMNIVIIGLNFAPELTGVGKYTGEMASWFATRGHQVKVVTTQPYYPHWKAPSRKRWIWHREQWQGCEVIRCPLYVPRNVTAAKRIMHLGSFAFSSVPPGLVQLALGKIDVVASIVPTLLTAPLALALARLTRTQAWIHYQDLEIDVANGANFIGPTRAADAARAFERAVLRRFDLVSAVSPKMLEAVGRKGVPRDRLMLFPNWVDTSRIFPNSPQTQLRRELRIDDGACVALYSGSIGHKQGLECVIAAARLFAASSNRSVVFVIAGAGPARAELQRQAEGLPNVLFLPLQPEEKLNAFLNLADIHLLPQRPSATDLVMPSKLGAMLATGKPVIATVAEDSQVALTIEGAGLVVPPENPEALAAAIDALASDPNHRRSLGRRGLITAKTSMEATIVLQNAEQRLLTLSPLKRVAAAAT